MFPPASLRGWWKHEINKLTGREAWREKNITSYTVTCDSWGCCTSPHRVVEFLCVILYFSSLLCLVSFRCYALTSEVNFTLPYFYLYNLFYFPPSTHFTPLMSLICFFFSFPYFCVQITFSQVNLNESILCTLILYTVFESASMKKKNLLSINQIHFQLILGFNLDPR